MLSILVALSVIAPAPAPPPLETSFKNPPAWAKPHTWWHWMAGNVTKEGITADLEAMKFAGIGGAHIFDAGQGIPTGPVAYNSPEWRDLMAHAMSEAQRLGLDMTMHNCSGWSSSGGPWVQPEDAMKRVAFRTTPLNGHPGGAVSLKIAQPPANEGFYRDFALWAIPAKAGNSGSVDNLTGLGGNPGPIGEFDWPVVDPKDCIDLTGKIDSDGLLQTDLPAGDWSILRIGYTLTGARNVASRPTGEGLEVDKLSAKSLDNFLAGGLEPLFKRIGDPVGKAFKTVLIDSYETGFQNWTPDMVADFKRLRGYDPTPYLAALAGIAVKDKETTQRFLFDYRKTLTDLWAENYSGHFANRLKEHGLQLAVEPYGNGSFDPFTYAKPAGLIMGEYWVGEGQINGSVKQSSSVAHVYGHSVVGAESLTAAPSMAGWSNQPRQWKPFADRGYAYGINRIIYHRFAHQPWVKGVLPGMTMGPWGSHVDRTETFWSFMPSWDKYLSRCQFMLQSGLFVADICVFTGEGGPQEYTGEGYTLPEVPKGFDFDYCGVDPLMDLKVKNGRLLLSNGASYRLLALPKTDLMTVKLARKVKELVLAGATVIGPKPVRSPSLEDGPSGDAEVAKIGNELWGTAPSGMQKNGLGRVAWGMDLDVLLRTIGVTKDFVPSSPRLLSIHRRIGNADVYFVASSQPSPRTATCRFRVAGKVPELWDPETGTMTDAPVWRQRRRDTTVDIPLEADGSVFVVFRRSAVGVDKVVEVKANVTSSPGVPPKTLKIVKAEYGQLGTPGKFKDVTSIVAAAAKDGALRMSASNDEFGGDPAYMVVKQLRVTYVFGDEERTVTVGENETLAIGDAADSAAAPTYRLRVAGGKPLFDVWKTGAYALQTGSGRSISVKEVVPNPIAVAGPWNVSFPSGWDAPANTTFAKLISWTDHTVFGIKYFSGTATYTKRIEVPEKVLGKGMRLYLDLGDVRECARVKLNGKLVGEFWKPPFRMDVTGVVKAGENELTVEVTNLWVNRLIGDEQFPDDMGWEGDHLKGWPDWFVKGLPRPEPRRKTFTTWRRNTKDTPLLPSGLIGPVVLRPVKVVPLTEVGG